MRTWLRSALIIVAVTLLAIAAAEMAARAGRAVVLRREGLVPAPSRAALSACRKHSGWTTIDCRWPS
jgi:hypothetical protein